MPVFIVLNWSTLFIICVTSGSGRGGDNGEFSLGYVTLKVIMDYPINVVGKLIDYGSGNFWHSLDYRW